MRTSRVISNISYNTPAFFENVVMSLYERHVIDWCYWILHKADVDELKNHIHFVLKPSRQVDTFDLKKEFDEFDVSHPSKPLSCTSSWHFVVTGHLDDWLLYAVHDVGYLASKGQKRNFTYSFDNLCATDYDALRYDWNSIDRLKYSRLASLAEAVKSGLPWLDIVQTGLFPMSHYNAYHDVYKRLVSQSSGRKRSHDVDSDGVVLSVDPDEIAGQLELSPSGFSLVGSASMSELETVINGGSFAPCQLDDDD